MSTVNWTYEGASQIIEWIFPYLTLKKDEAKVVLEMPRAGNRWSYTDEIRIRQIGSWIKIRNIRIVKNTRGGNTKLENELFERYGLEKSQLEEFLKK